MKPVVAVLLGIAVSLTACGSSTDCSPLPAATITRFEVLISTGGEGTDMDVYFCFRRESNRNAEHGECTLLDTSGFNDFEAGSTRTYGLNVSPLIAPRDLHSMWISTGPASFFDTSWDFTRVQVAAVLEGGSVVTVAHDQSRHVLHYDDNFSLCEW